ncbi:MAG: ABC transporter permease, partial [Gelidibacter sp.]
MIKNYFKIAFRNLWKTKGYSALNIFGLAIGITCASLIFLWVENEMDYDRIPDQDQVFYVPTNQMYEGEYETFYSTPGPLAQDLKDEIPEVEKAGRMWTSNMLFSVGDHIINSSGRYADPDMLEILGLSFIEGNAKTALQNLNSIVITKATATQLFGKDKHVLGKNIRVDNSQTFEITGVIDDVSENFTFSFNWLVPFEQFAKDQEWTKGYGNNFADTFVKLTPSADVDAVNLKVRKMIPAKHVGSDTEAILHASKDWHLRSKFKNGKVVGGAIEFVRLFSLIALIILLIACINFMNLSTARSEKRASEVGVRKALGSDKKSLILQFISEALLTAFIATVISVVFLYLLLPQFNILIEDQLSLGLTKPLHLAYLLGITLVCGILAGLYPAFYLSSFKPVEVLKGVRAKKGSATVIRKGLVIAQFAVSIVFIISTIVIYQQVQHVKNRDLGLEKENLIQVPVNGDIVKNFEPIKQELISSGIIKSVSLNSSNIFSSDYNGSGLTWQGGTETEDILIRFRWITSDFIETAGMEIVEGRGFSDSSAQDTTNILVTQSFAKLMGPGSAVGKIVSRDGNFTVIGVVKDYLYGDMYGASQPVLFFNSLESARFLYIKTEAGASPTKVLSTIEKTVKKYNPAFPFEYTFMDDAFNAQFKNEALVGNLSQIFALIAIIISCLGLFGLSAYTAEQRKKEIGVRRVLGSSVSNIVKLLSKDFMV